VPSNDCVRIHDQKRTRPERPRSAQQNPKQSVGTAQVGPLCPAFENYQLLPQGDDLKSQVMTRPNKASQPCEYTPDQSKHRSLVITRLEVHRPCFGDLQELKSFGGDG
jgi:hypothetical protein